MTKATLKQASTGYIENPTRPMQVIADDLWPEIAMGASCPHGTALPDRARPEVEALLKAFSDWPAREHVTRPTKETLSHTLRDGAKFNGRLRKLVTNEEYLHFNIVGVPASLKPLMQLIQAIDQLPAELEADKMRFAKRGARNMELKWRERLARGLLDIRNRHLNAPRPTRPIESKQNGRFKTYLTLCLRLAGVPETEIDDTIFSVCYPEQGKKKR
jgi:hypothetical protein